MSVESVDEIWHTRTKNCVAKKASKCLAKKLLIKCWVKLTWGKKAKRNPFLSTVFYFCFTLSNTSLNWSSGRTKRETLCKLQFLAKTKSQSYKRNFVPPQKRLNKAENTCGPHYSRFWLFTVLKTANSKGKQPFLA